MAEAKRFSKKSDLSGHTKRMKYRNDSDFVLNKRVPPRSPKRQNELYITNKSDFKGQLARVVKLLENSEEDEVILRGLGSAVLRTVNLALQTQEKLGQQYATEVNTYTVQLVDDLEGVPNVDEQMRSNSAIRVRIYNKKNSKQAPSTSDNTKRAAE